ncbi:substrate-binding domain-containing protein [Dictyobacter arantiisoli]|uniref:Sugar ABC transporter substrate-binding protein n=1 Tax=Dictyobacter arantiisoli TaxID=2014874 RepID=A0A5A5TGF8_9CHLR|nr:substrate-binding domain-containing protein [Dictyobacter arantiisoli]GCF10004.1 sugar ABC transporter substrate-binding protein [Dictyobacter arantiisoli]
MQAKVSRRTFLEIAGGTALATSLVGCFGVGGSTTTTSSSSSTGTVTIWDIRTGNEQAVVKKAAAAFNAKYPKIHANVTYLSNDPYKQKLQVAMGAHNPPDIFFGWGGGVLKSYIDANDVYDLTADFNGDATWKNRFLPSVLAGATFNGKLYGTPNAGMQPELIFYNKDIFKKYHLNAPQTWSEFLHVITTLKNQGIIPLALAGASQWPYLMYIEYLVDRIGGPDAFNAVLSKQANAWSQDAFIKANTLIQDLVTMGAFGSSFASTTTDTNQDVALLYTEKAGMLLQGNWNFSTIQSNNPDFITSGKLGWFPFPQVEGGKGNPTDVYGNPCNFYSISSTAKSKQDAVSYLKNGVLTDEMVKGFISVGDVPPVQGIESQLASSANGEWLQYNYNMAKNATNFQLSYDQILAPSAAQAVLTNLSQIFLKQITPKQFSDNMNKTLGA